MLHTTFIFLFLLILLFSLCFSLTNSLIFIIKTTQLHNLIRFRSLVRSYFFILCHVRICIVSFLRFRLFIINFKLLFVFKIFPTLTRLKIISDLRILGEWFTFVHLRCWAEWSECLQILKVLAFEGIIFMKNFNFFYLNWILFFCYYIFHNFNLLRQCWVFDFKLSLLWIILFLFVFRGNLFLTLKFKIWLWKHWSKFHWWPFWTLLT